MIWSANTWALRNHYTGVHLLVTCLDGALLNSWMFELGKVSDVYGGVLIGLADFDRWTSEDCDIHWRNKRKMAGLQSVLRSPKLLPNRYVDGVKAGQYLSMIVCMLRW